MRAVLAVVVFSTFIAGAIWLTQLLGTDDSASSRTRATAGLDIVVRTPQHLQNPARIPELIDRFESRGVESAWLLAKQDETEEFISGTALYPSRIAPVARGYNDDRFGRLVNGLAERGIAPLAWLPTMLDERAASAHPQWRAQAITPGGETQPVDEWLCPFSAGAVDYQASIAAELAVRYPALEGLYLDFIRFDDDFQCGCPECIQELDERVGWRERTGRPLEPIDIRNAADQRTPMWTQWTDLRADKIAAAVQVIRGAVREVRPDLPVGAFVLPFTGSRYDQDTNSGQDIAKMARAGLDDIVMMGYWDDWDESPTWTRTQFEGLAEQVGDRATTRLVLDGDMGIRRTRLTLERLGDHASRAGWFNFGTWDDQEFTRLAAGVTGHATEGPLPRPDYVSVVVRIDTEPDYRDSYAAVTPKMIDRLLKLFKEEQIRATFITVGKLAQQQPEAVRRIAAAGHEVGSHAQEHLQLDGQPVDEQLRATNRGVAALRRLGLDVRGFGAPRNSVTPQVRDRLMELDLEYDGSSSYDPAKAFVDVHYTQHSGDKESRIVVVPFIEPNDWDARRVAEMSAEEMSKAWADRLDLVTNGIEPVFVLDIHQWLITEPDNLKALRRFIRYSKACDRCRVETLREAASHARDVLDQYEIPSPTSGEETRATALTFPRKAGS